jgi:mono/diheme cytochrome c family protein
VDFSTQSVAVSSGMTDFRVTSSTALPMAGTSQASVLQGKRLFTTGLARWSLNGAAWGSCAACHVDGLTDNVTWYFARGPRQSTSLDGTFNKADPTDQRILNWTAVNDEIADFEGNVRGISGGVGAIVSTVSTPPVNADRINLISSTPPQIALEGSAATTAAGGAVPAGWSNITAYVQQIRSPRAATASLFAAGDITAGQAVFQSGNCAGCHGGPKWTISKVFYTPGNTPNDAFGSAAATSLGQTSWLVAGKAPNNFPAALLPSTIANAKTFMRSGPPTGFEQLQCVLRPVGTITANGANPTGVSDPAIAVQEVRQDMKTGAQGAGATNANDFTTGFNVPSLLGLQVGAPYYHAGNARTLEEAFDTTFQGHYQTAVANIFSPTAAQIQQLIAYLLSIDGSVTAPAAPAVGPSGGDLCHNRRAI